MGAEVMPPPPDLYLPSNYVLLLSILEKMKMQRAARATKTSDIAIRAGSPSASPLPK